MNYSLIDDAFCEASSIQRAGREAAIASFLASLGSGWRLFEILLIWCDFGKCLSIRLGKVLEVLKNVLAF